MLITELRGDTWPSGHWIRLLLLPLVLVLILAVLVLAVLVLAMLLPLFSPADDRP